MPVNPSDPKKLTAGCTYTFKYGHLRGRRCNMRPVLKDGKCVLHSEVQKNFDLLKNFFSFIQDRVQKGGTLEGAILRGANLQGVHLAGANLQDADLTEARFVQARLTNANLKGAKLTGADLSGANFREANLSNCQIDQAFLVETNLEHADLSMVSLIESDMEGAIAPSANFENANLNKANLFGVNLEAANLAGASLIDANMECANLTDVNLKNANMSGVQVNALTINAGLKNLGTAIRPPEEWMESGGNAPGRGGVMANRSREAIANRPVGRLLPDDIFGDEGEYRIIKRLGKGGSAFVYLVDDTTDPNLRIKAIKILDPNLGAEEINVKRFRREGEIGKNLVHPNIIRVFDVKYTKKFDTFYLVMEYIEGLDLKQYLKKYAQSNKPFPAKVGIQMIYQVCQGLEVAHARKIVHRDLKPGNLLIRRDGRVVLTDFGLSKIQGTVEQTLHLATIPGTLLGTFEYMSPEQVAGLEVNHLTDIYALGVIMYEMFVGQLPYKAHNVLAWVNVIQSKIPVPPSKINPYFPSWLELIILKSLEKDPRNRFQSVHDIQEAIKKKGLSGSA